ncbi:flagellar filament capping protein FliD [Modestobacter versicolor]|uniref:flagellar filament capping protein FliD n=1 Tax=Modestobacter versicolor TaxID=429133 RepID=UPI0034DE7BF7
MSVSTGLVSGIDYDSMIGQLMQVEANPQTLLKKQLSATNADATAYRAVNTRFDALRTAAAALTADSTWSAVKAGSSSTTVAASAGATAVGGSVTFTVKQLATTHSTISNATFTGTDQLYGAGTFTFTSNGTTTSIPITTANAAGATLADTVAAINSADKGVTASAVKIKDGEYRLQVTATTTGAKAGFVVGDGTGWTTATTGKDAKLLLGESSLEVFSDTNTFTGLLADTSITVSKADETATVTVAKDPSAVAAKVQSLVDAANGLLAAVSSYTDADSATAVLKGDSTLRDLSNQILSVVSGTVGGTSASAVGIQLTREGNLKFDKDVFTAKLASDPALVRKTFAEKSVMSAGIDGISGNADDVTSPVGLAARLEVLAKGASDTTTGSLVLLATSQDALAKDLQARIDAWDTRLEMRRITITRQFTAMETALSSMQNKASWLSSQIASLPSWSQSSK